MGINVRLTVTNGRDLRLRDNDAFVNSTCPCEGLHYLREDPETVVSRKEDSVSPDAALMKNPVLCHGKRSRRVLSCDFGCWEGLVLSGKGISLPSNMTLISAVGYMSRTYKRLAS